MTAVGSGLPVLLTETLASTRADLGQAVELDDRAGDGHLVADGDRGAPTEVKTKMPSEVFGSASLSRPLPAGRSRSTSSSVTMPRTVTVAPAMGEAAPLPWMSWMGMSDDVVVDDRALALAVGDGRADDVGDVDEEGLVRLGRRVAVDVDGELRGSLPLGMVWPVEADGRVVVVLGRGVVVLRGAVGGGRCRR